MAHYTLTHSTGQDHPTSSAGAELMLATAQQMAIDTAKKHRGTTVTVKDTTGAVVFTAGPFPNVTSQGT
jgi:hypothetical protein